MVAIFFCLAACQLESALNLGTSNFFAASMRVQNRAAGWARWDSEVSGSAVCNHSLSKSTWLAPNTMQCRAVAPATLTSFRICLLPCLLEVALEILRTDLSSGKNQDVISLLIHSGAIVAQHVHWWA